MLTKKLKFVDRLGQSSDLQEARSRRAMKEKAAPESKGKQGRKRKHKSPLPDNVDPELVTLETKTKLAQASKAGSSKASEACMNQAELSEGSPTGTRESEPWKAPVVRMY